MNYKLNDWLDGVQDCRDGEPADPKRNEAYQKGYGHQYQWQEIMTARQIRQESKIVNIR